MPVSPSLISPGHFDQVPITTQLLNLSFQRMRAVDTWSPTPFPIHLWVNVAKSLHISTMTARAQQPSGPIL